MAGTVQSLETDNGRWFGADIIRLRPREYIIRSKSNPLQSHVVNDGQCSCKGFLYCGKCRHVSLARGYEVAIECGYDVPNQEEIEYYARLEDGKVERARRGIPISPP